MRTDFPLAALQNGWSPDDRAEFSAAVKAAIESGDEAAIEYWAKRLSEDAAAWRAWCARVRAAEVAAREAAKKSMNEGGSPKC